MVRDLWALISDSFCVSVSPDVTWDERIVNALPESWCYMAREQIRTSRVGEG